MLFALLFLAAIKLIVNGIALSAIIFRISEWGISPDKLAVLISNTLIFSNLIWIVFKLLSLVRKHALLEEVENTIAWFLPF